MRRELEDQVARVRDLEEMVGTVEKNKREAVAVLEIQMKVSYCMCILYSNNIILLEDKYEEIEKLKGQVQNDALLSVELRKLLEMNKKVHIFIDVHCTMK